MTGATMLRLFSNKAIFNQANFNPSSLVRSTYFYHYKSAMKVPDRLRKFSFSNLVRKYPDSPVYGIIGINVGVWLLWKQSNTWQRRKFMLQNFTTSVEALRNWRWHTLFTSTFSHIDGVHLTSNMIALYFFGRQVLYMIGAERFFLLYAVSGIISSACQVLPLFSSKSYGGSNAPSLGASGAVNSLVALSICSFPRNIIYIYMIIPVPAALFGILFIGKDLIGLGNNDSTVGHKAHLSGALMGALYWLRFIR